MRVLLSCVVAVLAQTATFASDVVSGYARTADSPPVEIHVIVSATPGEPRLLPTEFSPLRLYSRDEFEENLRYGTGRFVSHSPTTVPVGYSSMIRRSARV